MCIVATLVGFYVPMLGEQLVLRLILRNFLDLKFNLILFWSVVNYVGIFFILSSILCYRNKILKKQNGIIIDTKIKCYIYYYLCASPFLYTMIMMFSILNTMY